MSTNIEFRCADNDKERNLRSTRKKHGYGAQHACELLQQYGAVCAVALQAGWKADWNYGTYFPGLKKSFSLGKATWSPSSSEYTQLCFVNSEPKHQHGQEEKKEGRGDCHILLLLR